VRRRVSLVLAGLLTLALVSVAAASAAGAAPVAARDAASTRAFIGGELGVYRALLAHGPTELAAGKAYRASVDGECGDVHLQLPQKLGGPRFLVFLKFAIELSVAYDDVTMASVRPAIDRIARMEQRLRFSDPALQWTVHGSTSALAAMLALRPPDICADVRRLQATNDKAITPAGARFSNDGETLIAGQSAPGALIRKMRTDAPAAVATGLRRLKTLAHRVTRLPVTRVELKLVHDLFDNATTNQGTSGRVASMLGYAARAQL
jgi:hypothetical protein